MSVTNVTGISLPLAVWLASDSYDFTPSPKSMSTTGLLKSTRQIVLGNRMIGSNAVQPDVGDYIASRVGHSIHDGIEKAWRNGYKSALSKLGYPDSLINRIMINPLPEEMKPDTVPIWLEVRGSRAINGYMISGKLDMAIEGTLQDFKSTSTYSYTKGNKDADYALQGSIYRWIHHDKITEDYINIQFIFMDWSGAMAKANPNYPQQRVYEHRVELLSVSETETWLQNKIRAIEAAMALPEADLPFCTDKDLWRNAPVYKYYGNPAKTDGKSTKNFDSLSEANIHKAQRGVGVVLTVPGKVKACGYCKAFSICTQKDSYEFD